MTINPMLKTAVAAFAVVAWAGGSQGHAQTVEYKLFVDEQDLETVSPAQIGDLNAIQLGIAVKVTDNTFNGTAFGLSAGGGDLVETGEGLEFAEATNFLGEPTGAWDFEVTGELSRVGGDLSPGGEPQQAGAFLAPADRDNAPFIGVNDFEPIISGLFSWDGTATTLSLVQRTAGDTSTLALEGSSLTAQNASTVIGDSVTFVPEPTTAVLLGLGGIAALGRRRRSA